MRLSLALDPYEILLLNGQKRKGVLLKVAADMGQQGLGDIAPLPGWSPETLEQAISQFDAKQKEIMAIEWTQNNYLEYIENLKLLPSLSFALESALAMILFPQTEYNVLTSALIMGTEEEIIEQAAKRHQEGFTSAKLKVSGLKFEEAKRVINALKDQFSLRIDVNRAWTTKESLDFFANFPFDAFDYIEEPFQNPKDLRLFTHPLAVDESFPSDLSFEDLEALQTLKALIYKPTIQGGLSECLPIYQWTQKKNILFVLSSSFESSVGLMNIASMAHRLELKAPIGIGTYHYLPESGFQIVNAYAHISAGV